MSGHRSDTLMLRESYRKAGLAGKTALVLSTWFGAGLMPSVPGTFGTLASLPVVLVFKKMGPVFDGLFLFAVIVAALWASGRSRRIIGRDDPPEVVIDEVAGFLVSLFLVPHSWLALAAAFVLFRIFDIWKPFPIRRLEKVGGGAGIVLDDLLAGVYANLCIRIGIALFG